MENIGEWQVSQSIQWNFYLEKLKIKNKHTVGLVILLQHLEDHNPLLYNNIWFKWGINIPLPTYSAFKYLNPFIKMNFHTIEMMVNW